MIVPRFAASFPNRQMSAVVMPLALGLGVLAGLLVLRMMGWAGIVMSAAALSAVIAGSAKRFSP